MRGEKSGNPVTDPSTGARTEVDHDRRLVGRVLADDPAAVEAFIQRMRCLPKIVQHLHESAYPPVSSCNLADIVQDAFGRVWSGLESYRGDARLETWAYAVARNCYREARRSQHSRAVELDSWELPLDQLPARPVPRSAGYERVADSTADHQADSLHRRLQKLDPMTRELVLARAIERASFAELAERFGESRAALKARYYRTLRDLRRGLPAASRLRRHLAAGPTRPLEGGAS